MIVPIQQQIETPSDSICCCLLDLRIGESIMVTKTEETQLNRLESQVDNAGGGAWEYLSLVRKLKVRRSDKVLKHGLSILNDPKQRSSLGPDGPSLTQLLLCFLNSVICSMMIGCCFLMQNGLCMSRLHLQLWIPTLLMLPRF